MSIIYEPKGKAREYSPLAANLFTGCTHGCKYCYVPSIRRMTYEQYTENAEPRRNILADLEREAKKIYGSQKQVQMSFVGDPYDKADEATGVTRDALKIFLKNKIPVSILTKGGTRALRDIDLFVKFDKHIIVGASLIFDNDLDSLEWEKGAALPHDRIEMLRRLKEAGVRTWASFEPVISPSQSLKLMEDSLPYVDYYKIGKLNNYRGIDKGVDWGDFARRAIKIMKSAGKDFYIKHDLRIAANLTDLEPCQQDQDDMRVEPFPHAEDFTGGVGLF